MKSLLQNTLLIICSWLIGSSLLAASSQLSGKEKAEFLNPCLAKIYSETGEPLAEDSELLPSRSTPHSLNLWQNTAHTFPSYHLSANNGPIIVKQKQDLFTFSGTSPPGIS